MGTFYIKKTPSGAFNFVLLASNKEKIAVSSQVYTTKSACKKGIESVRTNSAAEIEDLTVEPIVEVKHPKYQVYQDKAGEYRFRLKARNGEIIAASEGYKSKASCLNGIDSVKRNAPESPIVKED